MIRKIAVLSLKSIFKNKMRSFLTMLGIMIGVAAVVVLVSITNGAASGISESISEMGSDIITASVTDEDVSVTTDDVDTISNYPTVKCAAPVISTSQTVKKNTESGTYSIIGTTPEYFSVQDEDVQSGRILAESDNEWTTSVAVIGTDVAEDLFGTWDAVGGTITIDDRNYKVIGVIAEQGSSLAGSDDSKIIIPLTSAQKLTGESSISSIYIQATSEDSVDAAKSAVSSYLLRLTRDEDTYTVENQSDVLDAMDDVSNTMSLLLAGIASISLIVGGIGIMNIMLVSVTERTKEIGIRKAVGAKRRHIMMQFLCEACILSVLGGLIGLALSYVGIYIYNTLATSSVTINSTAALLAIGFCAVIGILFGIYPAGKASKLQPIEALRTA